MQVSKKSPSRKKFLLWSAVVVASATVLKFFTGDEKKEKEKEVIKMLTQDGKLVEIDKELLMTSRKKVSNEELQQWIKK
ncbi:MAG: hypothetical protein WC380_08435 [Pedobacter sp.]|jgi:heterodisulfide reductase subunit C